MPSEKEKMLGGGLYLAADPQLAAERLRARRLVRLFNTSTEDDVEKRVQLLRELFGAVGPRVEIEPPFHCDYGSHIYAGDNLFINFGCVILDCGPVKIGRDCMFGPGVHLYAGTHPVDPDQRCAGPEYGSFVTIGDRVWLGGGVKVCPGVTIGDESVIGAASVVTRAIPPRVVAAGNPCRVIRAIP
jgi:maltose O-acetyltransferase